MQENWEKLTLVRKDRERVTYCVPIVLPKAALGSYVKSKELLKASKQEIDLKTSFLKES